MADLFSIPFMRQALFASWVMGVILAYLGIHVVRRRIVFVDLAIAQVSALGVVLAMALEINPVAFSILFTLFFSCLLSLPIQERRIPQEAIMGIVYAVATAVAILLVSKLPHGEAELLNLFFGNILGVTSSQVLSLIFIAILVGLIHMILWPLFKEEIGEVAIRVSSPLKRLGTNLLFYFTLALVISVAIRSAGVLLVFSNLIIPPAVAFLVARSISGLISTALGVVVVGNTLGLYASYHLDLPSGPSMVTVLGIGLGITTLLRLVILRGGH